MKRNRPLLHSQGPMASACEAAVVLMSWALEENYWDLLVLPPSWAIAASSSLGGLSSNGGLVLLLWCDPGVN